MIKTIAYKNINYPAYQAEGNAAHFIMPFASKYCEGDGYDIGCNRLEWALPNAQPIDLTIDDEYDAMNLPDKKVDYIFSSHCLEHLDDWSLALEYWTSKLKDGGVLFLYLPHFDQEYWRPWNNRKHKHVLHQEVIGEFLMDEGYKWIISTGRDLNHSFAIVAEY